MNDLFSLKYLKQLCEKSNKELLRYRQKCILMSLAVGTFSTLFIVNAFTHHKYMALSVLIGFIPCFSLILLIASLFFLINDKVKDVKVQTHVNWHLFFDKKNQVIDRLDNVEKLYKIHLALVINNIISKEDCLSQTIPHKIAQQIKNNQIELYESQQPMLEKMLRKLDSLNSKQINEIESLAKKDIKELLDLAPSIEKFDANEIFLEALNKSTQNQPTSHNKYLSL